MSDVPGMMIVMTITRTWRGCVFIGTSLDGYIAKPNGDLSWLTETAPRPHTTESGAHPALVWGTFFPTIDTLVMGRTTYETVLGFENWPFEGKRVIVLSSTLDTSDKAEIARSVDEVEALLANGNARRVYIDGGRTIQAFLSAGLVDELTVSIAPTLLGRGSRLFGELDSDVLLTLRGHHSTEGDGLVRITYDVAAR
ncbi:dihydrofolate reductase family protein [Microbacterium testaceum]|uniref:dihydrofolate reductase family protein n=1 Tax=Microbacterium testaceum TaxID=2033 RepID=UPI0034216CC8